MAKVGDELRRRRVETARSGDVSEPRIGLFGGETANLYNK